MDILSHILFCLPSDLTWGISKINFGNGSSAICCSFQFLLFIFFPSSLLMKVLAVTFKCEMTFTGWLPWSFIWRHSHARWRTFYLPQPSSLFSSWGLGCNSDTLCAAVGWIGQSHFSAQPCWLLPVEQSQRYFASMPCSGSPNVWTSGNPAGGRNTLWGFNTEIQTRFPINRATGQSPN